LAASHLIATASLAKFISPAIDAGGSVKVIYDMLDDTSAAAVLLTWASSTTHTMKR